MIALTWLLACTDVPPAVGTFSIPRQAAVIEVAPEPGWWSCFVRLVVVDPQHATPARCR